MSQIDNTPSAREGLLQHPLFEIWEESRWYVQLDGYVGQFPSKESAEFYVEIQRNAWAVKESAKK